MTDDIKKEPTSQNSHVGKEDKAEPSELLTKVKSTDFVIEQYTQLNEHRRQVNSFSWQTPTIFFGALVLILSLNSNSLKDWGDSPLLPAVGFLAISGFTIVMLSSHIRNQVVRKWLDDLIGAMESLHGKRPHDYGISDEPPGKQRWELIHSSTVFSCFLFALAALAAIASGYFWVKLIKQAFFTN
jgi:hypothetical protein